MQFLKQGWLRIWKLALEFWLCHLLSTYISEEIVGFFCGALALCSLAAFHK